MTTRKVAGPVAAIAASLMLALAGCGGGGESGGAAQSSAPAAQGQTLTVFAAASLRGTFTELEKQFEAQNPGTDVTLTFAGSSDLAAQIGNGAPADVFASADENNMKKVTDKQLTAAAPTTFVTNTLQIAVAANNPRGIRSLQDLANPANKTVVCAPQVPCGAAATKVEQAAGVDIRPVSEEQDVNAVQSKVESGNADAGLVYRTNVIASKGKLTGIDFPQAAQAVNNYPIAVLKNARNADLANKWLQLTTGPAGQQVFTAAGFGTP